MDKLASFYRRCRSDRICQALLVLCAVYGLYVVFVAINFSMVPNGLNDPIYVLTGIRRTEQFAIATSAFGITGVAMAFWYMARSDHPVDFAASPRLIQATLLLLLLLALNAAAASLNAVVAELGRQFWPPLFAWVAIVLTAQLLIAYAVLSRVRQPFIHLILLAAFSGFNVFALYLSLLGRFLTLPTLVRFITVAALLLIFGALFAAIGKRIVPARSVSAVLVLTLLGPIIALAWPASAPPPAADRLVPFEGIAMRTRPNIHIVSFDALMPDALAEKFMGLTDPPYADILAAEDVTVFKNAFATEVPTRPSLNSLMRLAHVDFANDSGYFAGRTDGPLTHILRANGYRISTGFDQHYFGGKGPFVDAYHPQPAGSISNSSLCALATDNPYKFFSFCAVATLVEAPTTARLWPDEVISIVGQAATGAEPEFTLHYMVNPIGHTALDFRSSDTEARRQYAQNYLSGAASVAEIMTQLRERVRESETPSLLIVMGDHGPFLSRTVSFDENATYFVQDRHGILAAVLHNSTDCEPAELEYYGKIYTTPARIIAGVVRCLAADPARVDAAMKFEEPFDFEKFLYE